MLDSDGYIRWTGSNESNMVLDDFHCNQENNADVVIYPKVHLYNLKRGGGGGGGIK